MNVRSRIGSIGLLLLLAGTACLRSGTDHSVLEIAASDYAFMLAGTEAYEAGRITMAMTNEGDEEHMAATLKPKDGVTVKDLEAALKANDEGEFFSSISWVGGPNGVKPGDRQVTEQILNAGEYMLICFIEAPDGTPHFVKGMLSSFTVIEGSGNETKPVGSEGTLDLDDYSFDLSAMGDGSGSFEVTNGGTEPHEITLFAVDEGVTPDEVVEKIHEPLGKRPFTHEAGIAPLDPGLTGWMQLYLEPGDYVAVCFVPSPATGKAHFEMGMVEAITIT